MPRIARIIAIDYPHHITQRVNNRQKTFHSEKDYRNYLKLLDKYSHKYNARILAYCLMPNHVHFVAIPKEKHSFARIFSTSHMLYAQHFNKKHNTVGHLWQGRFYSCILDEFHLYAAIKYIENNPVRAKLVKNAEMWKWSSAKTHLGKERSILSLVKIKNFLDINKWGEYLKEDSEKQIEQRIRDNTLLGRPLGSEEFIKKLEHFIGRNLKVNKAGRPRNNVE